MALPIKLNKENIRAYLKFFCSNIHSSGSSYEVFNSISDLKIASEANEDRIADMIDKISDALAEIDDSIEERDDSFELRSLVQHGQNIHQARFEIELNGKVSMKSDSIVYESGPLKVLRSVGSLYYWGM